MSKVVGHAEFRAVIYVSGSALDFRFYTLAEFPLYHREIVPALKVHPELRAVPEVTGQAERRLGTNCTFAIQNRCDAS